MLYCRCCGNIIDEDFLSYDHDERFTYHYDCLKIHKKYTDDYIEKYNKYPIDYLSLEDIKSDTFYEESPSKYIDEKNIYEENYIDYENQKKYNLYLDSLCCEYV